MESKCIESPLADLESNLCLTQLLGLVPEHARQLTWEILEIEGIGNLMPIGRSLKDLQGEISVSSLGRIFAFREVLMISECMDQIFEATICGYEIREGRPLLGPGRNPELKSRYFFQIIDSAILRVCSCDQSFIQQATSLLGLAVSL